MPELSVVQVGILSSVLSEILKYVPTINQSPLLRALTALVVCLVGTFLFTGGGLNNLAGVVVTALATYKALVQPLASSMELRTQK